MRVKKNPAPSDAEAYGVSDFKSNEIRLYTQEAGDGTLLDHSFYHELVHFLLHYAGRDDLSNDEQLVDVVGGLLAQYEATKRP